jgi:hypothetical protein
VRFDARTVKSVFGNAPNYPPVSDPEALQVVLHVLLAELLSESRRVFSRGCAAPWIAAGRCQLQKIRTTTRESKPRL